MESRPIEPSQDPASQIQPRFGPPVLESEFAGPNLLQVIWQGRWIVLGITFLALAAGLWYLARATPIYESTSRVYVQQKGPRVMSQDEGGVMTQSRNYLYTQAELFKSAAILEPAVHELDVRGMKTFAEVSNPIAFLRLSCLEVNVGKEDEILSIAARSAYPAEAARIVNKVVDAYIDFHSATKKSTAEKVQDILLKAQTDGREALDKLLGEYREFQAKAGLLLSRDEQESIVEKRYAQLEEAYTLAQLETFDARAAYESLKANLGSKLLRDPVRTAGLQSALFSAEQQHARARQQLNQELHQAEAQLGELSHQFTGEVPVLRTARARVDSIKAELAELERSWEQQQRRWEQLESSNQTMDLASAKQEFERTKQKEDQLAAMVQTWRGVADLANAMQGRFDELLSKKVRAERYCDELDSRIKDINVTEDTGALNITILDPAKVEDDPVSPKKARTMALALVLGLMLGVGLAFLKDWLDHRLRSSDEMSAALAAPVLGVLPHMKRSRSARQSGQRVYLEPSSFTAEAFRTVRTSIQFNPSKRASGTLLITSPTGGDGKTTVTSNLAISTAQAGKRVLILDADLRRARQHEIFEIEPPEDGAPPDLAGVLAGEAGLESLIFPTDIAGLDVLPCLTHIPNPGEIINSPEFAELLAELGRRYDHVLVDSPPIMPVADARILATLCDATIVVLRAEKSTRKVAEMTRQDLENVGAHILGIAVNDVPKRKGGYGYYGYYGAGKYYRYDHDGYGENHDNGAEKKRAARSGKRRQRERHSPEKRPGVEA